MKGQKENIQLFFSFWNFGISTSATGPNMHFYEFATPARPVLKIRRLAQARASADTPATLLPQNTPTTAAPAEPIKVYTRQWQRAWVQKYLAAQMVRSAQINTPTEDDIAFANAIAMLRYGEVQRQADAEYECTHGEPANYRRWEKRDLLESDYRPSSTLFASPINCDSSRCGKFTVLKYGTKISDELKYLRSIRDVDCKFQKGNPNWDTLCVSYPAWGGPSRS